MFLNSKNLSSVSWLTSESTKASLKREISFGMIKFRKNSKSAEWSSCMPTTWSKSMKWRPEIFSLFLVSSALPVKLWPQETWKMLSDARVCTYQSQSWVWPSSQQAHQVVQNSKKPYLNSKDKTPLLWSVSTKNHKKSLSAEWVNCICKFTLKEWKDNSALTLRLEPRASTTDKQLQKRLISTICTRNNQEVLANTREWLVTFNLWATSSARLDANLWAGL